MKSVHLCLFFTTGIFLLSFPRSAHAGFPFGTEATVSDSVDASITQDTFNYTADNDDTIFVRMTVTSGSLEPAIHVGPVAGGQSIGPVFDLLDISVAVHAGTSYAVKVPYQIGGGIGVGSGTYKVYFQSAAHPVGAVALPFGQTTDGLISTPGEIDTYTFDGHAGDEISLQVTRTSGLLDPEMYLYTGAPATGSALGQPVNSTTSTDESALDTPTTTRTYTLATTGTFVLLIDDTNDFGTPAIDNIETGGYALTLNCVSSSCKTNTTSHLQAEKTLVAATLAQLKIGSAVLPAKPGKNLSKAKKAKINAQRTAILAARSKLKTEIKQLKSLEASAGAEIRVTVKSFTSKNLTKLASYVATGSSSSTSKSSAKSAWSKAKTLLTGLR